MLKRVTREDRAAFCRSAVGDPDLGIGGNVGVLEVGLDDPRALRVSVDDVVDRAVVLHRSRERLERGLTQVSARNKRDGVGTVGIRQRTGHPRVAARIETVVPACRSGEFAHGLIHLNSATDRRFLIPQQTTRYVHILEAEGVFSSDQRRQRADLKGGILPRLELYERHGYWSPSVGDSVGGGEERHSEIWNVVSARLDKELKPPVGLLNKDLPVAQSGLLGVIAGNVIVLYQTHAADKAVHGDIAERAGVEHRRGQVG